MKRDTKGPHNHSELKKLKLENEEVIDIYKEEGIEDSFQFNSEEESIVLEKYQRPKAPKFDSTEQDLTFHQVEIDDAPSDKDSSQVMVRMYGVTKDGYSVLCKVHGFFTYFYLPAPSGFVKEDLPEFKNDLDQLTGNKDLIRDLELVKKQSIHKFSSKENYPFIKVIVKTPKSISSLRSKLKDGITLTKYGYYNKDIFESNIEYILRFMIDKNVFGGNWITLPMGQYRFSETKISTCQYEVDIHHDNFISHNVEGKWLDVAPLRILSFDIECSGRKGIFPDPIIDPVIQIGNVLKRHGEDEPFLKVIHCLNYTAPIAGAIVLSYKTEKELLMGWTKFIHKVDPDLIIGYNISNFDFPYLIDRAKALKLDNFPYLGRIQSVASVIRNTHFSSKAYGASNTKETNTDGRLQLDILQVMNREYKLRSYSLNAVCERFLNETKEDVHYSIITELQNSSPETRRRLAVYCLKDAYLPIRLMDKLMLFINYLEMARVTGVPFGYILTRGQQIKVISQLYRKAKQQNFLIPHNDSSGSMDPYEGATVIEPKRGYYKEPIATLDFASLYPSIMMAHNLCYTTLIDIETVKKHNFVLGEDYIVTPHNDLFVTPKHRKGLLPIILEELIGARKRAKKDLKAEKDSFKKAVLDGRQLALKISANSVYGFTGATNGKLPCLAISSSTTAYGRDMINFTAKLVKEKYSDANVIYGDTDSVMVKFKVNTIKEAMDLGKEAAKFVSGHFKSPISLEFEKVYCPYLLISKKRYAGLYWSNPDKYDKLDAKGIETVRRDSCQLVSTLIGTCLNKALIDADPDAAVKYAKQVISDLLQNKIDMSQLVISKSLAKEDYNNNQPHSELAKKMRARDPGSAPNLGDRVPYVIITGAKGSKIYERAEDPKYVLDENLMVDTQFYLDNQISNPLLRIFEPILGTDKANEILNGNHTRNRMGFSSNSEAKKSGILGFTKVRYTCLGCKATLKDGNAVCTNCRPNLFPIYKRHINKLRDMEVRHARLWSQCQNCQGSLINEVQCASSDCPIFYMRTKAIKDLQSAKKLIDRFDLEW